MKKYEKIYVPEPDGSYEVRNENNGLMDSVDVYLASPNSTIVLTIEEALEMWNAAEYHGEEVQRKEIWDKLKTPDFKSYLQSKGIELNSNG